ncbi:MAG: flagellar hook-basal body complex protein FliE [Pseudomonadota bacterium]
MTIDALRASQAYAEIAKVAQNAPRTEAAQEIAQANFADLVKEAVGSASANIQAGEAAAAQVAAGEAALVDVVTAVSAAEVALESAIAVRNRVIEAYQEILRMPI